MPNISTLVGDIATLVEGGGSASPFLLQEAYTDLLTKRTKERPKNTLYFSEIGDVCMRRMWYKHHAPELGEKHSSSTLIKFAYGNILEELVLTLAKDAGHVVEGEQQSVEYSYNDWHLRGRIDAIIDGVVVDVKSVTKQSERKFGEGLVDDPFGYYGQLNGYACVLKSEEMGFLTIQKELGHINYYPFIPDPEVFAYGFTRAVKSVDRERPVEERLADVPASSTSENRKLCVNCSYCAYKGECFPEVRAFGYAGKIEWLTKVVKEPKVPELDWKKMSEEDE